MIFCYSLCFALNCFTRCDVMEDQFEMSSALNSASEEGDMDKPDMKS
jgi:hypothetical protein